jgi:hypothetical protein
MPDQLTEILGDLVRAHEAALLGEREEFMATAAATSRTLLLGHPGLPPNHPGIFQADLDELADRGWIRVTRRGRGMTLFEVTPAGIAAYRVARQTFGSVTSDAETAPPAQETAGARGVHVRRLREGLEQLRAFRRDGTNALSTAFETWEERVRQALLAVFGPGAYVGRFANLRFSTPRYAWGHPALRGAQPAPPNTWSKEDQGSFESGLAQAEAILQDALMTFGEFA